MTGNQHLINRMNRCLSWPLLCGTLGLLVAPLAFATDPIYVNSSPQNYIVPGNPPPNINATAFDNENLFNINFANYSASPILYETQNTLYFTNNDTMTVSSPLSLGGFLQSISFACGYQFDCGTTSGRLPADTFYNAGAVRCNSAVDGNVVLNGYISINGGAFTSIQSSIGEAFVSATNIINPGTIQNSLNGFIQLTGQNVDVSRGTLLLETAGAALTGSGNYGTDTNNEWNPAIYLTASQALSSAPNYLYLSNSTSYFNVSSVVASNRVIRSVFIQNSATNVVNNIYFGSTTLGNGSANVEWVGSYVDSATGQSRTNYLYLNNDYVLGASTNVVLYNGIPSNFTFAEGGPVNLGTTPTTAGFQNVFNSAYLTNPYSYTDVPFVSSTVTTNATLTNPYGSLTNLAGRIQISASKKLNLALVNISGANYMSLTSTNQFDGNVGAQISSAYSDINLGVTNGLLTVSNLLESVIPAWHGPVQAWSTRFFQVDSSGITNDYRVLLVDSRVLPTSAATVQDLILHSTNSVIVSDVFNVLRTLSIDSKSLTLTTNGVGVGAGSPEGELNWAYGPANNTLGANQFPNLRWLTNNGAIRAPAAASLGAAAPNNYQAIVNHGLFSAQGMTFNAAYFENTGTVTNGSGSLSLQSQTAMLTNGSVLNLGGDVSLTSGSLVASNVLLRAGRSLALRVTNLLTDSGVFNGNLWSVGGSSSVGLNLQIKPTFGDLLGTTITNISATNKNVLNTWSAVDVGVSTAGYTNNVAIGKLILDALDTSSVLTFNGTGTSNAMYVDCLELRDQATNYLNQYVTALAINPNMVIYYAQAMINGISVAEKLNGYNNNHLRWVGAYAGHFSSTNFAYPDGSTILVNTALLQSKNIDSDGDGIVNGSDPTPFFIPASVNLASTLTNVPPLALQLKWQTMPSATNYIYYQTNLASATWLLLTNFVTPSAPPYAPITNSLFDTVNPAQPRFYRVRVDGNTVNLYGP